MTLPTRAPIWTLLALAVGLVGCAGIGKAWLHWWATPAQAHYLGAYAKSALVISKKQTVSVAARKYPARTLHAWLDQAVYEHGRALRVPLYLMGGVLLVALFAGSEKDRKRRRALQKGMQVDGRRILTVEKFSKRSRDGFEIGVDGFAVTKT